MPPANDAIALYQTYGPALVRKARRVLQDSDEARDIVQSLFVDLMQRNELDVDLPYLYRAVTNRCLNAIRDRDNRRRLLEQQSPALRGVARSACGDRVVDLDLLTKLSDRLDARSLEIVVCLYVDDMTQDETADLLGVSRRAVVKRVRKIRDVVAALMGDAAEVAR